MIRVKLTQRLGNQMFQYAAAHAVARRLGVRLTVDVSEYFGRGAWRGYQLWRFRKLGLSSVPVQHLRMLRHRRPLTIYQQKRPGYREEIEAVGDETEIRGFHQSERYFAAVAEEIRERFALAPFLDPRDVAALSERFRSRPVASIHVRRGDYVGNPMFDLGDPDRYYGSALERVLEREPDAAFVVLSDDPEWCRSWPLLRHFDVHIPPSGKRDVLADLALLAWCRHHVIANSSFSWWGAWLGGNPEKLVVMPDRWFPPSDYARRGLSTAQVGLSVPGWIELPA